MISHDDTFEKIKDDEKDPKKASFNQVKGGADISKP